MSSLAKEPERLGPRSRGGEWWQTKFNVSPGPGLWSLVLGPFGPDLGPGPGPELDNINPDHN